MKAYQMKKIFAFLIIFMSFIAASNAEAKPKLAVSVFADETTCWTCLKSINTFSKFELKNYQLEITLYFCSDNSELMPKLLKQYELNIKSILDPECLYAKKYNISRIPAIVIKDITKDSIILVNNWDNPREYLNLMLEYDKNYKQISKQTDIYLTPPILIKEADGKPINMRYCNIVYHPKLKKYYCFIRDDEKTISILDSNGFVLEEINLQNYKEIEEFWSQGSPYFMNDSLFVWRSISKKKYGQQVVYGLNINTKKIEKKGIIDTSHTTNNSSVYDYNIVPKSNKLVFTKYYFIHNTLDSNEKLLLLTDTNFNADKYFGKVDPICETTTMAANIMTFPVTPTAYDSNIYYLMSLSNKLFVFDNDGKYLKTIELEFEKNYNPPLINIAEKINMDERFDIWGKYKILANIFVQKDKIIVVSLNNINNKETLKLEQKYYITVFDKAGKRIANTIALPKGVKSARQMIDDKLLVTQPGGDGSMSIRWFDIRKIIKQ